MEVFRHPSLVIVVNRSRSDTVLDDQVPTRIQLTTKIGPAAVAQNSKKKPTIFAANAEGQIYRYKSMQISPC